MDDGADLTLNAVEFGDHSTVIANIYAPNGTVLLRSNTIATGAFIGKQVDIGQRVELRLKSAF